MKKAYVDLPEGQIHYRSEGQGQPLLLLHQAPLSSVEWDAVIPLLSPHYRVIAPDMMGHGESSDPPREYEMADFTRTTLAFMDALGLARAVVCGNHSGAALATSIALAAPARVERLVVSCEMLVTRAQIEAFLKQLEGKPMSRDIPMTASGDFIVRAWERYAMLGPNAALPTRFKAFVIGLAARQRPFDAHYAVLRWMAEDDHLARVQCPTLVFGPERDLFFDRAALDALPARLPHCRSLVVPEAGALSVFEKPALLAEAILGFVRPH